MKILYAKCNSHRRPPFRIITTIVEEDVRYVEKRALTAEACGHIHSIRQGYKHLQENLIDTDFKLPAILEAGDAFVRFAFIEGRSLDELLLQAALQGDRLAFMDLLDVYHARLRHSLRTIDHFLPTGETAPIFKNIPTALLEKEGPFSCYSFLDPIFENIVIQGDDWYIIDNEWFFNGRLPVSFPFFRSLLIFCKFKYGSLGIDALISFEKLLERYGISEELQKVYHLIEKNFQRYVDGPEPEVTRYKLPYQKRRESIVNINQALADRDEQIAAQYHSYSWRITRPLRIIGHQLERSRRIYELARHAIRLGGGLKSTPIKAIQIYRSEGLAGIKRALKIVTTPQGSGNNDYIAWVRRYDALTDESRAAMRDRIHRFTRQPLISLVLPTYNPKQQWLIEAIESIRKQIYPYWELCIADDASTDKGIRLILERYAKKDARIKIYFREKNGHICAASNSALQLATGEWIALMDHDDLLAEHALFWVVNAINQNPDVCLIYSDEDKIDDSGRRFDPYFKCDWNVDLFYSQNMFSHLGVYRTDILNEIGGFREGMEGAQDYDLVLRCIERIEPKQIYHIPRVLYHWRTHAKSTAQSTDIKPYAMLAGEKALNEHLLRRKINARAEFIGFGYRIHYALPVNPPLVSLIIPTRNQLQLLQKCIEGILQKTIYPNYEILIVDNSSDEPATLESLQKLQSDPRIRVVRDDRPFNYSALNNAAVKLARGEIVGLLNNDLEVISPEWLSEMVSHALRPEIGAVGACLWYPDETLQHGGVLLGLYGVAGHLHKHLPRHQYGYFGRARLIQDFSAVTAACLVIRKETYEAVGGFNEVDLSVAFNDIDFCLRVCKAGYRNIWTPYAELYHHESSTRGYEDTKEKQKRFSKEVVYMKSKWGNILLRDPAYSPNLTLDHDDFSLAWPPRLD